MDRVPGIRPRPNLWQRIDALARATFPIASTAIVLLALALPFGLPGQSALRPALALSCVFFWSLHRPQSMPAIAGFLLGLLADLLGDAPIGIGLVALLIGQGIALAWRRALLRQEFLVQFLAFCAVALLFAATVWTLDSIFAFTPLPPGPALFQAAAAAGTYPILALFLLIAHRNLDDAETA